MRTASEARQLASQLVRVVTDGGPDEWRAGSHTLARLGGRSWLLLDEAARSSLPMAGAPVGGSQGWLGPEVAESTGFVAAVTSMHVDGRVRQRASRVLAARDGTVASAALAVRLLDHVEQVRDEATRALHPRLGAADAGTVLAVVLAGRGRRHAPSALAFVRGLLLERLPPEGLVEELLRGDDRAVRRWALALAQDRHLLGAEQLLEMVRSDPDQWVRASAAEWLLPVAEPQELRELLVAKTVEARIVALTRLPDELLADDETTRLLTDRAPRVREQAQMRARRRGIDAARWYRELAGTITTPAHRVAAVLEGLATVGGPEDLEVFAAHLDYQSARVRAAAVSGVSAHASADLAVGMLGPVLLDPSPRVASAAARALVRLRAPQEVATKAWTAPGPWNRRAAWHVGHRAGAWDRVEADLRAASDPDPQLVSLGRTGVLNWLETSAATTWAPLSEEQRDRVQGLLDTASIDSATNRTVAFHAGIRSQAPAPTAPAPATPGPRPHGARRWLRLVRRR